MCFMSFFALQFFLLAVVPVLGLAIDGDFSQDVIYIEIGDVIDAQCFASGARPQARLTWLINGDNPSIKSNSSTISEDVFLKADNLTYDSNSSIIIRPDPDKPHGNISCYSIWGEKQPNQTIVREYRTNCKFRVNTQTHNKHHLVFSRREMLNAFHLSPESHN